MIGNGEIMTNIMNQTMSFGRYMNGEKLLGYEELIKEVKDALK